MVLITRYLSNSRLLIKSLLVNAASAAAESPVSQENLSIIKASEEIYCNGVILFGNKQQKYRLRNTIKIYHILWIDQKRFAITLSDEEIPIYSTPDWQMKI